MRRSTWLLARAQGSYLETGRKTRPLPERHVVRAFCFLKSTVSHFICLADEPRPRLASQYRPLILAANIEGSRHPSPNHLPPSHHLHSLPAIYTHSLSHQSVTARPVHCTPTSPPLLLLPPIISHRRLLLPPRLLSIDNHHTHSQLSSTAFRLAQAACLVPFPQPVLPQLVRVPAPPALCPPATIVRQQANARKAHDTPVTTMIFRESESNNMGRGAYDTTGTPKPTSPPPPK